MKGWGKFFLLDLSYSDVSRILNNIKKLLILMLFEFENEVCIYGYEFYVIDLIFLMCFD